MAPGTPTGEPRRQRAGEEGFVLAFLVGLLTVLAIALTAALPHWAAMAQREKEAELLSRGAQYAEAIRVFQKRFGRLPVRLEELVEVEPRSIRRLWKNPIDPDAGWLLLVGVEGGALVAVDPKSGTVVGARSATGESVDESGDGVLPEGEAAPPAASGVGAAPGTVVTGSIHGVKSRAKGDAYHVFFGRKDYGEWEFTVDTWVAAASELGPDGLPRRLNSATFGRPFYVSPPTGGESGAPSAPPPPAPESSPDAQPPSGDGGVP